MRQLLLSGVLGGILVSSCGCCGVLHKVLYEPFGPGTMCDPRYCCETCDVGCGVGCGHCTTCEPSCVTTCDTGCSSACEVGCDSSCATCATGCDVGCGESCSIGCDGGCATACEPSCGCDSCSDACTSCCDPCGPVCHQGPLSWLLGILHCGPCWHAGHACDAGCGERYWGDFHGDPPYCCDPCDRHGNWTGGGCVDGACSTGGCSYVPNSPVSWQQARQGRPSEAMVAEHEVVGPVETSVEEVRPAPRVARQSSGTNSRRSSRSHAASQVTKAQATTAVR